MRFRLLYRCRLLGLLLLILEAGQLPAQIEPSAERYIARAGNIFVSEEEFMQRFEMLPGLYRHRKAQLQQAKLDLLYSMIAEKLLMQEAQSRKLDQDSLYAAALLGVRKLLARDELYKEEVRRKVTVTPVEMKRGIRQALRQVKMAFMFFDREEDAVFIRSQMKLSQDFERLAIDSSMNAFQDTATVIWGDAEEAIEQAAYALKVGQISAVVKAGSGYYILKCLTNSPSTHFTGMQPNVLKDRVESKIRIRKEHTRMLEFLPEILRGKTAYSRPIPLKTLSLSLSNVLTKSVSDNDTTLSLTKESYEHLLTASAATLADTLTVAGNVSWSVQTVITKLFTKGFQIRRNDVKKIPRILNNEIEFWAQQELLSQEAIRRGVDQRPEVQNALGIWQAAYLADMMKSYAHKQVNVSEAETWAYLKSKDTLLKVPQVRIRELRTSTLNEMRLALAELNEGVSLPSVIEKWSVDLESRKRKGLSEWFAITERQPLGEIASQMDEGQSYGPVRLNESYSYFQLVAKKDTATARDTVIAERKKLAATELLAMKQRRFVSLFLSQVGAQRGFEIYQDRLLKLEVSTIPMMTYRLLGFGGRMFEVPFVDPQLDWLDIEPPKETILP